MNAMDRRQKLIRRLDHAWCEFLNSYDGLSQTDLLTPGVTGQWSVKDIIAHVTTWEEEALRHLPLILQGGRPPKYLVKYGGIDAFNAQATASKKDLPILDVLRQQDRFHQELINLIEGVSEEHLGIKTRFAIRLRLDTYGHYRKHAAAIKKWRAAGGRV
jgi:hypothetical protein